MPTEPSSDVKFEIGHVLFIDIVGYSKLLITEQSDQLQTLRQIVRSTEQFKKAEAEGKLLRLPTGDGGALVFRNSPEAPALCALEIATELKNHPELRVRMGIHSGPVNQVTDLNEQANIAGAGINLAQRVMDCGDAGHILLSRRAAGDLEQYPQWRSCLEDLGECEVKHGTRLSVVNLCTEDVGNTAVPTRLVAARKIPPSSSRRLTTLQLAVIILIGLIFLGIPALIFTPAILKSQRSNRKIDRIESAGSNTDIPEKSIAVLPFVNMSGTAGNNDFSDGITEEILNALSQIGSLKVVARTSAFQFKNRNVDLRKVGETLGVAYVLEGSVQRAGDDVRITAQLIDARTGYHKWGQKYDRKLTSIFAIEDEISKAIARQMQVALGSDREQPLVKHATADPRAHELYLKGLARITERGAALNDALTFFKEALGIDPNYAAAWAGLSQTYELLPWYKLAPWQTSLAQAEEAARRGLTLDPQLAEAHTGLANVLRDRGDFSEATKEYRTAMELNPGSAETINQYAQMLLRMGEFEEAVERERAAVALDPLAPNPRYILGMVLGSMHRYDEAIAAQKIVVAGHPKFTYAQFYLSYLFLFTQNYQEAEKEARAAAAKVGEDPEIIAALIRGVANPGERTKALTLVSKGMIGRHSMSGITDAFWYAMLRADDLALQSLEKWLANSEEGQLFDDSQTLQSPAFDTIRSNPRFRAVMESAGLSRR